MDLADDKATLRAMSDPGWVSAEDPDPHEHCRWWRVVACCLLPVACLLSPVVFLPACGPALPAAQSSTPELTLDVPVERAEFGERRARLTLAPPLAGELEFRFDRCEWAGSGRVRLDRACIGSFTLDTPHGRLTGAARALWTGYRALLALNAEVRVGHGCLAPVTGGDLERSGPVSFPQLAARVRLTVAPGSRLDESCVEVPRAPDFAAAVRAAREADPRVSGPALDALAAALASPRDEVRAAALATIGFAAPEPVYQAFCAVLAGNRSALAQLAEARELRAAAPGAAAPDCAHPAPADDEAGALQAAACAGFERGRQALVAALAAGSRQLRREAAALLAWTDPVRAAPLFEAAIRRAMAAGELTAAVDYAEVLLASPHPARAAQGAAASQPSARASLRTAPRPGSSASAAR
jgi:hypothetical protein